MLSEISEGKKGGDKLDYSDLTLLARGCDPIMAEKAPKIVAPACGNVKMVACTNDADFIAKLKQSKWSVVFLAPGMCRYSAGN